MKVSNDTSFNAFNFKALILPLINGYPINSNQNNK